jgi:hypothetical protein
MHDDEPIDPEEVRYVLRRVAAYREVCERVRKGSTGALVSGGIMLAIWYFLLPDRAKFDWFGLVYLTLACLEFGSGLLNRLFPSAEGVLLAALVLMSFGGWNIAREVLIWQKIVAFPGANTVSPIFIVLGFMWLVQGFRQAQGYLQLRRQFAERPTGVQIRWFNDLLREIKYADPKTDPQAVFFDTQPALTGKLLGDTAFFVERGDATIIVARRDVRLEREELGGDRPARGYLSIRGAEFPPFPLGTKTWENFVQWKREGGEEPPPPVVRRARRDRDDD